MKFEIKRTGDSFPAVVEHTYTDTGVQRPLWLSKERGTVNIDGVNVEVAAYRLLPHHDPVWFTIGGQHVVAEGQSTPSEEQRLDFAYGNLAASTNHKPCRDAFRKLAAEQFGWSTETFDRWADARKGWRNPADPVRP